MKRRSHRRASITESSISNIRCKSDGVTSEQPGADNRDDETTTGFLEQRIQFESTSSEIICLSLSSHALTRSLVKSHLATDRSRHGHRQRTLYASSESIPIDVNRCFPDIFGIFAKSRLPNVAKSLCQDDEEDHVI